MFLNSSNTELAPERVGVNLLPNFPFIESRRDVPAFAVKGKEITNAQVQEEELDESRMYIASLPRCCPIGYRNKLVGGDIFEQGFEETFASEFDVERIQWLKAENDAFTWEPTVYT